MKKNTCKHTYCNPLPIPNIPRGKDEWYKYEHGMFSHENKPDSDKNSDYRSISDPTVMFYDNKWYLYPSYGMCFYSEDFLHWDFYKTEPYCPKYSPTIIPYKDGFLLTSWFCPLYFGKTPFGPFTLLGDFIDLDGNKFTPCDPGIFIDDDGRIYLYAYDNPDADNYYGYSNRIIGYELDKDNPCLVIRGPICLFEMDPFNHPWERHGKYNQDLYYGWVEGPHMYKKNGRYYLIYASPDTRDSSYCNAVYYSDTSPLDNFICQKRNPLTKSQDSLIRGAGHGCVCDGPNDTIWCFYTIAMPISHKYERRIGMDQVFIDENGELYCKGVTKNPQIFPYYEKEKDLGLYNLTASLIPEVSSIKNDHFGIYITDESNLTYWQPDDNDIHPSIVFDLGGYYQISSFRIWFRDVYLNYKENKLPKPIPYIVKALINDEYVTIVDNSNPQKELNIDYVTFDDMTTSKVKLELLTNEIGIIDFSLFGKMEIKNG